MKTVTAFMVAAWMVSGCLTMGSAVPHEDGATSVSRDAGPMLCRDGTAPPCNSRD